MAKLNYDEALVEQAVTEMNNAKSYMSGTSSSLTSAIGIITGARGANYIDTSSMQPAVGMVDTITGDIETTQGEIAKKVQMILEYNSEVDSMGFVERLFGTAGLIGTKFVEGLFTGGEQIIDGFASAVGWVA